MTVPAPDQPPTVAVVFMPADDRHPATRPPHGWRAALYATATAGALVVAGGALLVLRGVRRPSPVPAIPGQRETLELIDGDGAIPQGLDPESIVAARRIARRLAAIDPSAARHR